MGGERSLCHVGMPAQCGCITKGGSRARFETARVNGNQHFLVGHAKNSKIFPKGSKTLPKDFKHKNDII